MMRTDIRDQALRRVDAYDGSIKVLGALIAELDAMWSAEAWSPDDAKDIRRAWGVMEEIYAAALNHGAVDLTVDDQQAIKKALAEIRQIIQKVTDSAYRQ